jgi:hypothetical protein
VVIGTDCNNPNRFQEDTQSTILNYVRQYYDPELEVKETTDTASFQEIRIIATGSCITNQLRDVNTIYRRSWYIAAHIWKIYDFKIEVVPFIINLVLS